MCKTMSLQPYQHYSSELNLSPFLFLHITATTKTKSLDITIFLSNLVVTHLFFQWSFSCYLQQSFVHQFSLRALPTNLLLPWNQNIGDQNISRQNYKKMQSIEIPTVASLFLATSHNVSLCPGWTSCCIMLLLQGTWYK